MIAVALGAVVGFVGTLIAAALVALRHAPTVDEALAVVDVPDDETPVPLRPTVGDEVEYDCGCRVAECQWHEAARERTRQSLIAHRERIAEVLAHWSPEDDAEVQRLLGGAS